MKTMMTILYPFHIQWYWHSGQFDPKYTHELKHRRFEKIDFNNADLQQTFQAQRDWASFYCIPFTSKLGCYTILHVWSLLLFYDMVPNKTFKQVFLMPDPEKYSESFVHGSYCLFRFIILYQQFPTSLDECNKYTIGDFSLDTKSSSIWNGKINLTTQR